MSVTGACGPLSRLPRTWWPPSAQRPRGRRPTASSPCRDEPDYRIGIRRRGRTCSGKGKFLMDRLTSIVVGIDFSPASLTALAQALRFAEWNRATVHAVHVVDTLVVVDLQEALSPLV